MSHSSASVLPTLRLRRLRRTDALRDLVRECSLSPHDLILPIFVDEGIKERQAVASMPGVFRETEETLVQAVQAADSAGVRAVMLFGVSHHKDHEGSDSFSDTGLLARMLKIARKAAPELCLIADVCFCEYTDHGHCGPLDDEGDVDNDRTIANIARQAVVAARAGADMIAPSGMMDGQVAAIRAALDDAGFSNIPVMAYASKFASSFYGPFRDAAGCSLGHVANVRKDRKTYQLDPANARAALREARLDEDEGADILMVKPGMAYLDILARLRHETDLPLAVYQVSGEYAMLRFAAQAGALDYQQSLLESLLAFKRAGADMILCYASIDVALWLRDGRPIKI